MRLAVAAAAELLLLMLFVSSAVAQHADILALQPVPDARVAARELLQGTISDTAPGRYFGQAVLTSSHSYGYGSSGRHLLQLQGGTYGTHALSAAGGGYGYGSSRSLLEQDSNTLQLEPFDPLLVYAAAEQHHPAASSRLETTAAAVPQQQPQAQRSSSATASRQQAVSIPAGKCYCRYDSDFNTWALAEDSCRQALYTRCQTETSLPCSWLDKFYAPRAGPGFAMPHEPDIAAFVYEDCRPTPPCACAGVKFDGSDAAPLAVACCRSLRVSCKTPFSGVQCPEVEAFCSDDKPTPVLAAWSQHILQHADCRHYTGAAYEFVVLQELQQPRTAALAAPQQLQEGETQQPAAAAEPALLGEAIRSWWIEQQQFATLRSPNSQQQRRLVIALAAVAAVTICVAAVAVAFAMSKKEAAAQPITSAACEPLLSTAEVYESLLRSSASLAPPKPAALVGAGCGLPLAVGPLLGRGLRQDGSGDSSSSCLSRVSISIGRLSTQGSGISEHLPQHGLSRSVSNGSDAFSMRDDSMS